MSKLEEVVQRYLDLGINQQIDYEKFYLYSIITHSTAIEGSTVTELENQLLFDEGITAKGKTLAEQQMNLDLKAAYDESFALARKHAEISMDMLRHLASIVMKGTGKTYRTALGDFSSSNGDLRLLNVTAGVGGRSYMSFNKVPQKLNEFCQSLNETRRQAPNLSIQQRYDMSFDAHFRLVTIHPWADGNGRMSRLLMNHLQFEFGLIPTKILKEDKEDYIMALIETREQYDLQVFRDFMSDIMVKNLNAEIQLYLQSTGEAEGENADVVFCGFKDYYELDDRFHYDVPLKLHKKYSHPEDYLKAWASRRLNISTVWNFMFSRNFLDKHNIHFIDNCYFGEDTEFTLKALAASSHTSLVNSYLYIHAHHREQQTMKNCFTRHGQNVSRQVRLSRWRAGRYIIRHVNDNRVKTYTISFHMVIAILKEFTMLAEAGDQKNYERLLRTTKHKKFHELMLSTYKVMKYEPGLFFKSIMLLYCPKFYYWLRSKTR